MSVPNHSNHNNHTMLLFFSNHSSACKTFMELCERVPDFKRIITPVCVDNKETRDRISESDTFRFKKVPTLAKVEESGTIEIFEGEKAFQMLNIHLTKAEEARKLAIQQNEMNRLQHQLEMQKQMIHQLTKQQMMQQQAPPPPPVQPSPSQSISPINDVLDDGSGGDHSVSTYMHVPKNRDTDRMMMEDRGVIPDRAVKRVESQKTNSITNLAAQMAKERESINPPAGSLAMSNPSIP